MAVIAGLDKTQNPFRSVNIRRTKGIVFRAYPRIIGDCRNRRAEVPAVLWAFSAFCGASAVCGVREGDAGPPCDAEDGDVCVRAALQRMTLQKVLLPKDTKPLFCGVSWVEWFLQI